MDATATINSIAPASGFHLWRPPVAALYLGIKTGTLAVWRTTNRRKLAYVKIGGRVLYRKSDLDAFIAANLHNADGSAS